LDIKIKKEFAKSFKSASQKSTIVILTDYKGLDVEADEPLRESCGRPTPNIRWPRNRFFVRASEGNDVTHQREVQGPSAIALS
jgi:ribosomal protein L10